MRFGVVLGLRVRMGVGCRVRGRDRGWFMIKSRGGGPKGEMENLSFVFWLNNTFARVGFGWGLLKG